MLARKTVYLFTVVALLMSITLGITQASAASNFQEVDVVVNRLLDMYNVPGVAIGIVQDGKVVYTKGYGYADVGNKRPVTEQTVFSIGSVSKSFTVLDLAQLADAGKLDLNAPVIQYLPDFKLSDPAATKALTVRQVISHASGLPRSDERFALTLASRQQIVADLANIPLTAKPGEKWQYCNQNFVLAGYLVEQISGQSWEQYTQQHVFDALGMQSGSFGVAALQKETDHANPYSLDTLKGIAPIQYTDEQKKVIDLIGPAGSINANVMDMSQYALFQLGDGSNNGKPIVSQKLFDEMHTRQIGVEGMPEGNLLIQLSVTQDIGYGYGWITETYRDHKIIHHDGEISGYTSEVTLAPDDKLGIVILSNLDTSPIFTEALRLSLLEMLLGLKPQQDVVSVINKNFHYDPDQFKQSVAAARAYKIDPTTLDKFAGNYSGIAGNIVVTKMDGTLHLVLGSQNIALIPYKEGAFLANGTLGITISFKSDDKGILTIYQDTTEIGKRLSAEASAVYKDPNGHFTVNVPTGLAVQQYGDLGVIQTTNPDAAFVVASETTSGTDLKAEVQHWLIKYAQITNEQPVNVRDVPIDGAIWTQYLYSLPDGQLLTVVARLQNGTIYFVSAKAKQAAMATVTPIFNSLLLSFKPTS